MVDLTKGRGGTHSLCPGLQIPIQTHLDDQRIKFGQCGKNESFSACQGCKLAFVCDYLWGLEEEAAMLQIHHLSFQLVLHHIHQGELISQLLRQHQRSAASLHSVRSFTIVQDSNREVQAGHLMLQLIDKIVIGLKMDLTKV